MSAKGDPVSGATEIRVWETEHQRRDKFRCVSTSLWRRSLHQIHFLSARNHMRKQQVSGRPYST